jgi:translation initiation factor RLI1
MFREKSVMKRKNKVSFVDYDICNPSKCNPESGICFALSLCPHHVMKQFDGPYEPPMIDMNLCQGCNYCAEGCPLNAIKTTRA